MTPQKPVRISLSAGSAENDNLSEIVLSLSYKYLRMCSTPIIPEVNTYLKNVQLLQCDRLENRLAIESRLIQNKFKSIRGGHKQAKFNNKVKQITVNGDEIEQIMPRSDYTTPSQPSDDFSPKSTTRIDIASDRHKRRLFKSLENSTNKALVFVEEYGVRPLKLICESFDGKECSVTLDGSYSESTSYENMSNKKQAEVKEILQICDKTMISDEAYHEIAMKAQNLPRKSHLVACRNDVNSDYEVKRTPGSVHGSYISIKDELRRDIKTMLGAKSERLVEPLKIKIAGDGARVSRVSNFVVLSYSYVCEDLLSHSNQKVLAIVNCEENYENIKNSIGPLLDEISELNSEGCIEVDSKRYSVELFVGGDMKFLQILLGLNGSTAMYACPWCKVHKDDRSNTERHEMFYHEKGNIRSISELQSIAQQGMKKFGVKNAPLLNIEPDHYIPDELHLLMRVTDVLLRNLIYDAKSKDEYAKITGRPTDNIELLVNAIKSCGIPFRTWVSIQTGELEWTALSGTEKKKLLNNLPDKLLFCIHEDTHDMVVKLWRDFYVLYTKLQAGEDSDLFKYAKEFIELFIRIGRKNREGYQEKNVTPYMHCLVYHVPVFVQLYGGLGKFSGQGVEKTNDIVKLIHRAKSNKHDPTRDALLVRKRLESQTESRTKRKYEKVQYAYWNGGISHLRQQKRKRIEEEMREVDILFKEQRAACGKDENFANSSVKELKDKLTTFGVKTKLRKKEKLIELLRNVMGI